MGSKRKGGAHDLPSTSEEDESSDRKKRPVWKTFRIYSTEYVTSSNRDEKKSAKIALNVNTTEREIREILIRELPQLRGKRFKFFTKDEAGKRYFCPCSLQCEGKDHSAEWNGRNIPRAAKSSRAVYILIQCTTMEQTKSRRIQNDTLTNPVPTGPQFPSTVGQYSSFLGNQWNQNQVRVVVKNHQSVSCPDLSLSGLEHQENTSVQPLSAKHGNDLNQWPTQLIHLSQETERGKVKDGGRVTEEKDRDGEGRIGMGDEEMQTDTWNSNLASSSGYDTFSAESSTYVPPENLSLPIPDEELKPYLDSMLPSPTPTLLMEIVNGESARNLVATEEIVPIKGDIKGGDRFVLRFAEPDMVDQCQVRFGIADPVPVMRRGNDYWGNNPPYPTPGEVQVQLVSLLGDPISDTVTFTYTDDSAMKKWTIKPQDIQNMDADDLPLALLEIAHRMGQMRLQPKENANQPGDVNTEAMLLLRIIADTAAKINAIDFFRIVFSTNVGHSVFKCFKDEQPLLEDIARENGHDELASLLEEKHLMYQDDENDSDNEVDWKELVKAIEQYQTLNSETNEKKSIRSAISSETMYGYLGDGESPTTLSSSDISVAEGFPKDTLEDQDQAPLELKSPEEPNTRCSRCERLGETADKESIPSIIPSEKIQGYLGDGESSTTLLSLPFLLSFHLPDGEGCTQSTFEDQQSTQESMCGEEPSTCQSTAAEGCPESTFEEQQTTPESTCEEEPNTCETIAAEGCPENTLEEQETIPKSRCREKLDTCQTSGRIARGLIQDGMSDTDIINTISSSDQLRMNKAHQIKESQSSIGEKNLLANKYLNPLHLAGTGPIIMGRFQMDKFAPKEVSSLRRKLGPFDAAKIDPSALYPDRDQTIYNLMERLETSPALDFLKELDTQDLAGGLKAQKASKHPGTAEKELYNAKGKGETVINTESITSLHSPLHSKMESGSASNISLQEQSTKEEISQDARGKFEEHFFKERFFQASKYSRNLVRFRSVVMVLLAVVFLLGIINLGVSETSEPASQGLVLGIRISIGVVGGVLFIFIIVAGVFLHLQQKQIKEYRSQFFPYIDGRLEIDLSRTLHENCDNLAYDPDWEFPEESLILGEVLRSGAFGQIIKAEAVGITDFHPRDKSAKKVRRRSKMKTTVAVKTLKAGATIAEYKDLASELKILIHVGEHKNIVNLLGACTKGDRLLIITEFAPHGNLSKFLRKSRDIYEPTWETTTNNPDVELTISNLAVYAYQIARGMEFLASKKCIHRDLATRNILVGEEYVIKVADFGLARDVYKSDMYVKATNAGVLPVKWMALESLFDRVYTEKSDVWSFGVCLWEIFTLGGAPYPGIPTEQLLDFLSEGHRMEQPHNCPLDMYTIMRDCWEQNPDIRPTFVQLSERIGRILELHASKQTSSAYITFPEERNTPKTNYYLDPVDSAGSALPLSGYAGINRQLSKDIANGPLLELTLDAKEEPEPEPHEQQRMLEPTASGSLSGNESGIEFEEGYEHTPAVMELRPLRDVSRFASKSKVTVVRDKMWNWKISFDSI